MKWNEYTWYSKLAALIVFILLLPILTFYMGRQFERTMQVLDSDSERGEYSHESGEMNKSGGASQSSNSNMPGATYPKPQILSLNPSRGPAGANVVINGLNFDTKLEQNLITFSKDGKVYKTDTVRSSSGETLNFSIPGSVPSTSPGVASVPLPVGTYSITVKTNGGTSGAMTFTVTAE